MEMELLYYRRPSGRSPVLEWLGGIPDRISRARIMVRLDRVAAGNFGEVKPAGGAVLELRLPFGPGYRIYFAKIEARVVLLLCGGDKHSQFEDIRRAQQ